MKEYDEYATRSAIVSARRRKQRAEYLLSCTSVVHDWTRYTLFNSFTHLFLSTPRYDFTGVAADQAQRVIEGDWIHLLRDKNVLDSPQYLCEKGKRVIALWGPCGYQVQRRLIQSNI